VDGWRDTNASGFVSLLVMYNYAGGKGGSL